MLFIGHTLCGPCLELDLRPTFDPFSSTNEHKNIPQRLMLVLYSASTVVSSVASLCFIFKWIKSRKLMFYGVHSCLSPVEIQDLTPPPPMPSGFQL